MNSTRCPTFKYINSQGWHNKARRLISIVVPVWGQRWQMGQSTLRKRMRHRATTTQAPIGADIFIILWRPIVCICIWEEEHAQMHEHAPAGTHTDTHKQAACIHIDATTLSLSHTHTHTQRRVNKSPDTNWFPVSGRESLPSVLSSW